MKTLIASLLFLAVGCSSDDPPVFKWTCTCTATCDGASETLTDSFCATQDEFGPTVDDIVAQCNADLASCSSHACACDCPDTTEVCP